MSGHSPEAFSGPPATPTELLHRFSRAVDQRRPQEIADLFTEDGVFRPGDTEIRGRAAIEAFYRERLVDPRRTTRHLWSNVEIAPGADGEAELRAVLTNYAFEPKVSETDLQMRLGDLQALCLRGTDGGWRFATHLYQRTYAASLPLSALPAAAKESRT